MKEDMVNILKEQISNVNNCSLCIDEWESENGMKFIGIIVNFITKGNLYEYLISVEQITSDKVEDLVPVLKGKITTDGGSSLVSAVKSLRIPHVWCFNHILNLCVCDAIEKKITR